MAYDDEGSGEAVVLLHGLCGSAEYWVHVIPKLAEKYRVIVPDLRGHGESGVPDEVYTMEQMADDIAHLLDRLGVEKAALFGHSLGGYVTLAFAEKYPERLTAFSLVHSTAHPDSDEAKAARDKAVESIAAHGMEPFIKTLVPRLFAPGHLQSHSDEVERAKRIGLATNPQGAINTIRGMKERQDRNHVLRETSLPVLLVAGAHDQVIPPERTFSAAGGHITQALLPAAGHIGMLEDPQGLCGVIYRFLTKE
nr:alpha/beta hydrolase [Brevibacillus sp. SYP-B805]